MLSASQSVEKGFAEFAAKAANPSKSFSTAACTWAKIHLRLQVWNLFVIDEQIMRAADCKKPSKSPGRGFSTALEADILSASKVF